MPVCSYLGYTDLIVPRFAVLALIAALVHRKRTGTGLYLDLSQLEAILHFLAPLFLDRAVNNHEPERIGNASPDTAPHSAYRCKGDDRWLTLSVNNDDEWKALCQILGEPHWFTDPRFNIPAARKENEDELNRLIEKHTVHFRAEELMKLLQQEGVPSGVVQNHEDLLEDPQLNYRDFWWWLDHKEIGSYPHLGAPFSMSGTPAKARLPAPCFGEHTEYICLELLKMPIEEFDSLLVEGIF